MLIRSPFQLNVAKIGFSADNISHKKDENNLMKTAF